VPPTPRRAARVLLINGANRLLLFRGFDPIRPEVRWWFTAGGGLDPQESVAEGAVRELFEETGLRIDVAELGEPVWHQVTEFSFGAVRYLQEQDFFLVRVASWEVVTSGFDPMERESIEGHRWWSVEELERTEELFYPRELPALLRGLLKETAC
jgi:8-oxo-dGTP pyrophosphatase MutT (NUDIX family)